MIASVLPALEKQVVNVGATFGSALVAGLSAAAAVVSKVNETDEETGLLYYYYKLTYAFSAQPNMTDLEVGDSGTFTKRGWDYMWTTRIRVDDQKTGNTLQLPRQVNVEQVYPYVNLNALGLDFAMFLNLLRN